jgi:hypothetical protein
MVALHTSAAFITVSCSNAAYVGVLHCICASSLM